MSKSGGTYRKEFADDEPKLVEPATRPPGAPIPRSEKKDPLKKPVPAKGEK